MPKPLGDLAWLVDPRPALAPEILTLRANAPLSAAFVPAPRPAAVAAAPKSLDPIRPAALSPATSPRLAEAVPLPAPRPPELRARAATAEPRPAPRRSRQAAAAPTPDTRNFFERLLGLEPARPAPALSYAALDQGPLRSVAPRRESPSPFSPSAGGDAVYDISARTVTLPGGERLEAHSGLGDKMDDPRFVHVRMRGATPPGTYELTEREALFHGVRAIRLNPVGGSGAIHGRAGLLAHTYMLGPSGQSNGCVSLRDYDRFLQAFLRGEIRRLIVVAGDGSDAWPRGRSYGARGRPDRDG
ncbi:MAG: DUF2778 domain-containing protein [Methylobacteriaceae bacterium]|nr:DUF2778 domain-containing protein [Methylobacteriaceae bacterium]